VRGLTPALGPLLAGMLFAHSARAAEGEELSRLNLSRGVARTPAPPLGTYFRTFAELSLGRGLHLNNPYRLGSNEAIGLTATYVDFGVGVAFGPPDGLAHGGRVSLLVATDGINQQVVDFSYVALLPLGEHALLRGRAGLPVVLNPDATVGLEMGVGGAWLFTGGIGATAELVGSLFYGAATPERATTTIPVLALQVGAWFDFEVLP
jgi:hypothetical protein